MTIVQTEEEGALLETLRLIFEEKIAFNRELGMKLQHLSSQGAQIHFAMQPRFVGNFQHGILHGGVIATVLDTTGGLVALLGTWQRMEGRSNEEKLQRFEKLGTIDLRVDYLRPGRGETFTASASVLRTGNKVAVTRMELHNQDQTLIAVGTGTYLVG